MKILLPKSVTILFETQRDRFCVTTGTRATPAGQPTASQSQLRSQARFNARPPLARSSCRTREPGTAARAGRGCPEQRWSHASRPGKSHIFSDTMVRLRYSKLTNSRWLSVKEFGRVPAGYLARDQYEACSADLKPLVRHRLVVQRADG